MGRRLVWTSRDESVERGTPSVLAVVETVAVVAAVFWLSYSTGSLLPIALPAIFAPLLLLRTKVSSERNLTLFLKYLRFVMTMENSAERMHGFRRFFLNYLTGGALALIALVSLACRFAATVSSLVTHPVLTVSAIPSNWWTVATCVDITRIPELAPGIEKICFPDPEDSLNVYKLSTYNRKTLSKWKDYPGSKRYLILVGAIGSYTLLFLIWFVPAAWYRWTLKASSVVYAPLAWAVHTTRARGRSIEQRLEDIKDDELERIRRAYSYFALVVLTIAPFMLGVYINQLIQNLNMSFSTELVHFWVLTGYVKLWHVARFVNAFLTISLFIYAGRALRKYRRQGRLSEGAVSGFIRAVSGTRAFLGIYLSAKLLHLVVTAVDWRSIDWVFVPW